MTRLPLGRLMAFAALGLASPVWAQLSPAETRMTATVDADYERTVSLLERLVNQNSGSMNLAGVEAVAKIMRAELEPLGFRVVWKDMSATKRAGHLIATRKGSKTGKRLLLIAHLDTA